MATKAENILNPRSCWNKAHDNEPVFVLRANDPIAADIVVLWANRYRSFHGGTKGWMGLSEEQQGKFKDALAVAEAMRLHGADDDIPF